MHLYAKVQGPPDDPEGELSPLRRASVSAGKFRSLTRTRPAWFQKVCVLMPAGAARKGAKDRCHSAGPAGQP